MAANVESMFYVGDTPWHKEGTPLKEPPNTIAAIKAAGLDWTVEKIDIYSKESKTPINGYYGIMRNDNKKVLGVVRKGYTPLQNSEAFNFFDPLIASKFMEYETAGALGEGEIIWILAKIKENGSFSVKGNDEINKYLLLSNSHDGQSALNIKFTPIRVVCQNTLNIALSEGETTRIRHITNLKDKMEDAQIAVENICRIYKGIEDGFNKMAATKISEDEVKKYFNDIYPVIDEKQIKTENQNFKRNMNINIQKQLLRNFEEGLGVKEYNIGGTLWAAYNAVTEYIDHPKDYKLGDNKLVKRIWFGDGEIIKKKAYVVARNFLKAA